MATSIHSGRWTAHADEGMVVFLIGARINRWRGVRRWLPVTRAMGPMLRELYADPDSGFLGGRTALDLPRGVTSIQYWKSVQHLERYARDPQRHHQPAWKAFYQRGADGSVGIWHETYVVSEHETIYGNMPAFGLGQVADLIPVSTARETARARRENEE